MVAVRNLLSTLNGLAQSGLMASGWLRRSENDASGPMDGSAGDFSFEPSDDALYDGPYAQGGVEPPLEELLDDPVVRLLMRADHLEPEQVRRLMSRQG